MNRYNTHRNHIRLYCSQPTRTQSDSEAELSDFPPIKERNSTPPTPPVPLVSRPPHPQAARGYSQKLPISNKEEPQSKRRRQPNTGRANIVHMVDAIAPIPHARGVHSHPAKSPLNRRDSGIQDAADERPLKKQRLTLLENDRTWVQYEIAGVKESLEKIAAEARDGGRDINNTLQELLCEIRRKP